MADAQPQIRSLSKTEKAAIMLLCMDEKATSALFNELSDEEIRKVGGALLKLNQIPTSQITGVMEEFTNHVSQAAGGSLGDKNLDVDGKKMVERIVQKTLPKTRSKNILSSIRSAGGFVPASPKDEKDFGKLVADYSEEVLYDLLKEEHPQVIAILLSYTKKKTSKAVLEKFSEEIQIDVVARMAKLQTVSGQALAELRQFVAVELAEKQKAMGDGSAQKKEADQTFEGLMKAVATLKSIPRAQADKILQEIEKNDPELAQKISKQMFTIEDLERAEDAGMRELLRAIKTDDMKIALKNAPDAVKQKFFKNMSERAAGILREDMEVMPPVKVEEVEVAQENIVSAAKKLIQEEKLRLVEVEEEEEA